LVAWLIPSQLSKKRNGKTLVEIRMPKKNVAVAMVLVLKNSIPALTIGINAKK
jgi:hypothetical protein